MTAHRTAGQLRALRELCALARTGLEVCEVIAAAGQESDDRPRNYLLSLERWTREEESGPKLAARTRAMNAWQPGAYGDDNDPARFGRWQWSWAMALGWLVEARGDLMRNPGHAWHSPRVFGEFVHTVERIAGETPEAAKSRVAAMLEAHRGRVIADGAAARYEAAKRRAKADKVTAERALGTLPGME